MEQWYEREIKKERLRIRIKLTPSGAQYLLFWILRHGTYVKGWKGMGWENFIWKGNRVIVPSSHWLDLSIDDAVLRIHADDPNIMIGIVSRDFNDYETMKRKKLFLNK